VKRGALIALDQMPAGRLTPEIVLPMLSPADLELRKAASRVLARHPEWAAAMLGHFRTALSTREEPSPARRDELALQLAAFVTDPGLQELIASTLTAPQTPRGVRLLLLETIADNVPPGGFPDAWRGAITRCLADADEAVVRQAVLTVRALPESRPPVLSRVDAAVDFPEVAEGKPFPGTKLRKNFAARWAGVLRVPRDGRYAFATDSNDGSRLYVDGRLVVDNGGTHGMTEKAGDVVELRAGDHAIRLDLFQSGGAKGCRLLWSPAGHGGGKGDGAGDAAVDAKRTVVPAEALFHRPGGVAGAPLAPGLAADFFSFREDLTDFPDLTSVNFDDALLAVARDADKPAELRVDALSVAAPRLAALDAASFELLLASLDKSRPALLRAAAADAVSRAMLDAGQLERLAGGVLAAAGPAELPKLLAAFSRIGKDAGDARVGQSLVAALDRAPGGKALRPDSLQDVLAGYPPEVRASAAPLLDRLSATANEQKARLEELERTTEKGDPARGRAVFFGPKAACSTCHAVGDQGDHVGPELTRIGAVRNRRDLLEAIAFPSATFAREFEPYIVRTKAGATESGVLTRETADAIVLTTGPRTQKRIARASIKDLRLSDVSVMPQGLDTQLSAAELADLVAFLTSLK
jgi:putative heme-binding domain-containing protein